MRIQRHVRAPDSQFVRLSSPLGRRDLHVHRSLLGSWDRLEERGRYWLLQPLCSPAALTPASTAQALTIPWSFEANDGQVDSRVNYLARGNGYTLYLTPDQAVLDLQSPGASTYSPLTMQLIGSNPAAQPVGLDLQAGQSNYFVGNNPSQWITNIANYGQVEYQQVYQGVSLDYHGTQGQLEFDFTVAPGADPSQIRLQFSGGPIALARRPGEPGPPAIRRQRDRGRPGGLPDGERRAAKRERPLRAPGEQRGRLRAGQL